MPHQCYACDPANPDRIYREPGEGLQARISARFTGPPGNANGGIATGMLACPARGVAGERALVTRITARVHAGVPVDRALRAAATQSDGAITVAVSDGATELISGTVETFAPAWAMQPGDQLTDAAPGHESMLSQMAAVDVPAREPFYVETGDHPIPGCFSCGPENPRGLHVIPRVVSDGVIASARRPGAEFDDGNGAVSPLIQASALDCSSGICMPLGLQQELLAEDKFFLLGTLDVRFLRLPPIGVAYRIIGQALRRDGRKFYGLSAMVDARGGLYAYAEAIWIVAGISRTAAFGG
jgi:hypothetical protein